MLREHRVLAVTITALTLGACAATATNQPTPSVPGPLPTVAPTAMPATIAPSSLPTAAPATVAPSPLPSSTALPTAAPTALPAPRATAGMPPEQAGMPGPGWKLALTSDVNRDGVPDMVYYHPSDAVADVSYSDPRLAAVAVAADAIEIVQIDATERRVLLSASLDAVHADVPLLSFATAGLRTPAAYLLALDPAQGPLVNLLPYGAGGVAYDGPFSFDWNPNDGAFRLIRS